MAMKMDILYFLLVVLSFVAQTSHCEPNYQTQQQPGGNDFSGAGGGGNALYNGNLQQQQLAQQPRPYPPALTRFRPAAPASTAAPTFFQRISSWFSFLGDDSGERRPPAPAPPQQQQPQYAPVAQLPPQQRFPPQYNAPGQPQPTPSVQTQQQLQFQQQQQQFQQQQQQQQYPQQPFQQQQPQQPQPPPQQQFPYPFQFRNGSRATQLTPVQPSSGFQPSAPIQESGSSYHAAAVAPNVPSFVPSTLQQQIVPPASAFRDPEPITSRPQAATGPADAKYHPCNNVPWVPIAAPPEYPGAASGPGVASPPKVAPSAPANPPIKIQVAPKGQVQSVSPFAGPSGPEPAIITAAPHAQQLIQLQLQQQQHQLQNLQLQQLQLQQQQLQQQLQQLKTTTTSSTVPPAVQTGAPPKSAHFITKASPVETSSTIQPITLRQVSASYFTNKEYAPPAKLLPIQNEGKPLAPIPLPNLSATPIPPLYTAGSFHSDPYKFYRPYRPLEPILELGHGYPLSSKSMSDSYTRYPHDPNARKNGSEFEVEQFATSASSSVYTTVSYSNGGEDSRPEASEKRNVATSSNGNSGANKRPSNHLADGEEDTEYDSEEDQRGDHRRPSLSRTTVEVSSVVPQTRYYGSTTTSTMRPPSSVRYSTFQDQPPTTPKPAAPSNPAPSNDLGNGVQIIYSANLQTHSPVDPVSNRLNEGPEESEEVTQPHGPPAHSTLGPPTITTPGSTTPVTVTTPETDAPDPTGLYTEPFRIGSSLPAQFQRQPTAEPASQTIETTTKAPEVVSTVTPQPSSLTAAFGGYQQNGLLPVSTKKPKQIQIIIPYHTYKKPEPFRPLPNSVSSHLDDLDYNAPEESSIVTSKHTARPAGTTPSSSGNAIGHGSPKESAGSTRFIENDSVKYFQSTALLRDILQKETTQPFMKAPTKTPPPAKPAKVKKVRPVEISKESKPFTVRVPKMTPMPPVVSLSSLTSVRGGMERHTTPLPTDDMQADSRPPGPLVALSKYARPVTPHYVNVTRVRVPPTTYAQKSRTTISQLLRTTKIIPKGPKLFGNDWRAPESSGRTTRPSLSPASTTFQQHRRTSFLSSGTPSTSTTPQHTTSTARTTTTTATTTSTTTEQPATARAEEQTEGPIYERKPHWEIDPNELQRKIDTWTEQEFGSDDFARKSSTLSLHRVTKAIPWEFLTSTMLPSLHDRPGKSGGRSGWHNVKIAISPITKEKIYVVTPQPWTAALLNNHHHNHQDPPEERVLTPRFSVRPTPLYYKGGGIFQTGSSTVDVSPESVNDLLEQKPKHRFSGIGDLVGNSATTKVKHLLQRRKYVRKKQPAYATGRPGASREDV